MTQRQTFLSPQRGSPFCEAIWLAWPLNGQAANRSKGRKSFVTCQLVMQAHEGESILSYSLSVHALEMTKPPSGGSQAAFSTPVTNKHQF